MVKKSNGSDLHVTGTLIISMSPCTYGVCIPLQGLETKKVVVLRGCERLATLLSWPQ